MAEFSDEKVSTDGRLTWNYMISSFVMLSSMRDDVTLFFAPSASHVSLAHAKFRYHHRFWTQIGHAQFLV